MSLRQAIQKVATGPEYSKDLDQDEAYAAMSAILADSVDLVQAGVFLVALRMKRETDAENKGVLKAIMDVCDTQTAQVPELVDIADPYDGHARGVPTAAFIAPVLAACDIPAVSHGLQSVGPKYGVTHRMVYQALGLNVDLTPKMAAQQVAELGWAYVDQRHSCPALHNLVDLRTRIVKRPVLTTVEVLTGPIRALEKTHLYTGYVHKAYPPVYAELARFAGFDSAMIVKGVEGGVVPSISQEAKCFTYHDRGAEQEQIISPKDAEILQENRCIAIPDSCKRQTQREDNISNEYDTLAVAQLAAELGNAALRGTKGPFYDSLVYAGALVLRHINKCQDLKEGAETIRRVLDSGAAAAKLSNK